ENKKKNEGQDDKKEDKNNDNGIGHFSFFQANLWAFPIRSDKEAKGYTLTTNANWQEKITSLADALKVKPDYSKAGVSPERKEKEVVEEVDHLPVIARNCLDNGESKNLWYEEVVPAESCFVFFISYDDEEKFKLFDEKIQSKPVQIGANGSIGYGFCSIKNISKYDKQ
ncbi:type III-B CRISPR module RAMP protein Cmr4, partial [Porphyromonas loveana]|uniref:type III-B CRISPR module RAMP protein Cmr4 n=1 Tax=Porphyromonas loveana TaxID=1884669 RepID=UPI0035A19C19